MYKLSSKVIDYYDDNKLLLDLIGQDTPEIVKTAHLIDYEEREQKEDDLFAVVMLTKTGNKLRKYPVFDEAHTWLSCKAFEKTAHQLPLDAARVAASNLYANCIYYNLECPKLIQKMASNIHSNLIKVNEEEELPIGYFMQNKIAEKKALKVKDEEYGLIVKVANKTKKLYPLNTEANISAAINYFDKFASKMTPEFRRQFACNIAKQAAKNCMSVPDKVKSYSAKEKGNKVEQNLKSRRKLVKTAEEKKILELLIKKHAEISADQLVDYIYNLDKTANLTKSWDRFIKDPYLSVYETSEITSLDKLAQIAIGPEFKGGLEEVGMPSAALKGSASNDVMSQNNIRESDIVTYAHTEAGTELPNHLPDDLVQKFLIEPIKTFEEMSDLQRSVVIRGILGQL